MAGMEATVSKRNRLPSFYLYDFISEVEEGGQTHATRPNLRRELQINALKQSKYISPIVTKYQLRENDLNKKLPDIAIKSVLELLTNPDLKNEAPKGFTEKLRKIMNSYGYINEEFNSEMNKWLEQRRNVIERLRHTVHMLQLIKRTTSTIALITSAMELARGIGYILDTFFAVDMKLKYPTLLSFLIGGVSVTSSVLALSYSKQTTENIYRDLREEKYLLRNLLIVDRKGNSVDEDVEHLFPHGIDIDLVTEIALDNEENFLDDTSWSQNLSFAILLPSFRKNKNLIHDGPFLASVKLFVESAVAKIWIYRIKLGKMLDEAIASLENHMDKKMFSASEVFNQAAINMYPIFFPLFTDSRNGGKLRFICSSMAATTAVVNLSQKGGKGFDEIIRASEMLLKDYKNIKTVSQDFMNEYD